MPKVVSETPPSVATNTPKAEVPANISLDKPKESPKPAIPSATSINISIPKKTVGTLIPSLNDLERLATGEDDGTPKTVTGEAREPFSYETLLEVWNNYIQMLKAADKINLYTILNNFAPALINPTLIEISVESKTQEQFIVQESVELMNYLRNTLQNFAVDITFKQVARKIENRLYGNREKYDYLVNKNPKLDELRKRFNLDINP